MKNLKQRFLLVSDMHYTTEETDEELRLLYPDARTSVAAGNAFGRTQRQKIDKVTEAVIAENAEKPLDAVLVLGDLSIDDYDARRMPFNYCRLFKEQCMDVLPCPAYAQPGNHDSYTDPLWRQVFGYPRQYSLKIGDCAFIMLDTFAKCPGVAGPGAPYNQPDLAFLQRELKKYPTERIFLCAHYFEPSAEAALGEILKNEERIVCLFRGHTHHNAVMYPAEYHGTPLVDIGGYAYAGHVVNGKYTFNIFDEAWAWGYEILEIYEDGVRMYHVKPTMDYKGDNGDFHVERIVSGELEIARK
jgi:predicted phosphodiesterase